MDELNRPARSIVKIHLVGPTRAVGSSGLALLPRSKRARAVLAVVGLSRDHQCLRSQLASLLWDEATEDTARANLRQALHGLARSFDDFAPGFVQANRDSVALDRQYCWIDVHAFGSGHCDPKLELAEIADFNPQRLLEDLNGLSPSLDDWLLAERTAFGARLSAEMDRQLGASLRPDVGLRQRQVALGYILKCDPTHEQASRAMMRTCVEMGETAQALKEFERSRIALRTALDVEPSSETRALYQTIRTAASKISAEPARSTEPSLLLDNRPLPLPAKPSIAVLPFQNMSGDPEQEYFADGMVEEIITALSRFKSLFVIARSSSFAYKGKSPDIRQVGRELGVRYVLEGSVRKSGNRIRITGQLVEAATGNHLRADRFDGELEDVFDLQDRIVEQVVGAIGPTIAEAEIERTKQKRPDHLGSYDHVLRAMVARRPQVDDNFTVAFAHLKAAIKLQPDYALAYARLAECYAVRDIRGGTTDFELDAKESNHFARKALALDSNDPEVLCSCALAFSDYGSKDDTMRLLERATSLNPNLAYGWYLLGVRLSHWRGDPARGLDYLLRALRLAPVGPMRCRTMANISSTLKLMDKQQEAYEWAERAYQENSDDELAIQQLVFSASLVGDLARATTVFQRMARLYPGILKRTRRISRPDYFEQWHAAMRLAGAPE